MSERVNLDAVRGEALARIERGERNFKLAFFAAVVFEALFLALFLLAEYGGIVVLCALTSVLFLGGWHGPYAEWLGWLWTLLKTMVLAFVVIWLRVSYPRMREDQLQRLAWQGLVPVALAQLALTGVVAVVARMGVMEFLASGHGDTALQNDQTVLRGIQHIDAGPRQPASFVLCDQLIVG